MRFRFPRSLAGKIRLACLSCCPFYGGCPHLGGSVKGGSTVVMNDFGLNNITKNDSDINLVIFS